MTKSEAMRAAIPIATKYGLAYLYDAANGEWYASAAKPLAKWKEIITLYSAKGGVVGYKS